MKLPYEDIEFLVSILNKLGKEEQATLLSIIISLIEKKND